MANLSSAFKARLERNPKAIVNVIVRVQETAAMQTKKFESLELKVKHAYTLIPGFALKGSASAVLALTKETWVVSVEEDKQVHTM